MGASESRPQTRRRPRQNNVHYHYTFVETPQNPQHTSNTHQERLNPPTYQEATNHSNAPKMAYARQNAHSNYNQRPDRKPLNGTGGRPQHRTNNNSAPKQERRNEECRQQQQTQKPHQKSASNSRAPPASGPAKNDIAQRQSTSASSGCTMHMLIGGRCLWTVSIGNYEYVPTGCVAKLANMARDTVIDDLWRLNLEIRYIRRVDDPNIKAALVRNNVARKDESVTVVPLKSVPVILRAFLGKDLDDVFMANLDEVSIAHIRNKRLGRPKQ